MATLPLVSLMVIAQQVLTRMILKVQLNFLDGTEPQKALKVAGSGLM